MTEHDIVTGLFDYSSILPIILTIVGLGLAFYYFQKTSKSTAIQLAASKKQDDLNLAKEVKEKNVELADTVKKDMEHHISAELRNLRKDIEMIRKDIVSEINLMKQDSGYVKRELLVFLENHKDLIDRMEKRIGFMEQFMFGVESKSIPSFLKDDTPEDTKEHRDKPPIGIFKSPDSTETQKAKDDKKLKEEENDK